MQKKLKALLDNEMDPAFSQRAKIIFEWIEKKRPSKILDIGCGRGFYVHALTLYDFPKEIVGIDKKEEYVDKANKLISDKRTNIFKGSIYSIPFKDNYFDFIICSELLEHLPDDKRGLAEINRVLKKSGTLLLTVPSKNFPFFWDPINWLLMHIFNTHINSKIWFLAGIWADHVRLYEKNDLIKLVKSAKFKVNVTLTVVSFAWPFTHFILYGIGKNIVEVLGINSLDRFDFKRNKIKQLLSKFFALPTKIKTSSHVNIIISATKSD